MMSRRSARLADRSKNESINPPIRKSTRERKASEGAPFRLGRFMRKQMGLVAAEDSESTVCVKQYLTPKGLEQKNRINELILSHCSTLDSALYLDDAPALTTRALLAAGAWRLVSVNWESTPLKVHRALGAEGHHMAMIDYLSTPGESFNLVYLDFTGNPREHYQDLYKLFQGRFLNSGGILAVTLAPRDPRSYCNPFDIEQIKMYSSACSHVPAEELQLHSAWNYDSHSWTAYYTGQVIADYANRFGYSVEFLQDEHYHNVFTMIVQVKKV